MFDSRRVFGVALLLLPAGLVAFFAFNSGGFPASPTAYAAILLSLVMAIRLVAAADPLAGGGRMLAVAGGAGALYTLLVLLSERWGHIPANALLEFDRALIYLLVMILMGTVAHTRLSLVWILRLLAGAIVIISAFGLMSRVLPHVVSAPANIADNRLSYPVTYWNVLGLLAAFGIVLCLHFASDETEPIASRIAGSAALPLLVVTLYFTFSRGSIATCLLALVVYVLLARPRALLSGVIAIVPALIAVKVAYDANLLSSAAPTSPAALLQGRGVAVAVAACIVGAALLRALLGVILDRRLAAFTLPQQHRRRIVVSVWSALTAGAVILLLASSGTISRQYHRFLQPAAPGSAADLRTRLTNPGNNGRVEMWKIAWHEFKSEPLVGQGAGTFADQFAEHRVTDDFVLNAHSVYMENLDELGVVGLVLLLIVILTILGRTALRARGPNRSLYAAVFAVLLAWALESGIDWDWQMPVVTVIFFALGGLMLTRTRLPQLVSPAAADVPSRSRISSSMRTVLAIGCLLLAVAPGYVWISQRQLDRARKAFASGDCRTATNEALSSISTLGIRPEPYELISYCDARRDLPLMAVRTMQRALSLDPGNWNYAYGFAVVRAAGGLNPLAAARLALRLNPREPLVKDAWDAFSTDTPAQWQSDGKTIADAFTGL